ncbi:Hnrnpu [Symbiodinium natans]|uniref:Hnrnpu protein n=1 Tax=Symbiodinium natans TaxID=878477 RepID=A0A812HNU8_9DINO|nr:Hnrnpu [Symbiodinium natans]
MASSCFLALGGRLNEGGLHYLFAGARANVGLRAGRYMFEVRILELLSQAETGMPAAMRSFVLEPTWKLKSQ